MKFKILNKKTCLISKQAKIGKNVLIYPNNVILGNTEIYDGCILLPNNVIIDSKIGKNSQLKASFVVHSTVGEDCTVGPFANLRENNIVGNGCRVGDFVELKNCVLGDNTKASHMSYLGDVDIGRNCNIGAGVIFANYDGKKKHHSFVGNNVFLGCNCNVISPVKIADNTFVCAGTTLTQNTQQNDFVIGRVRESIKHKS